MPQPLINRRQAVQLLSAATLMPALRASAAGTETTELSSLTLKRASELLRNKSVSSVELTQACLKRIGKLNPAINAFITVTADSALETARRMQEEAQRGKWRGPLHGIPWALDRISGGSSGGSAAAIISDLCFGTLGTDTGGSIRIPSSDCGTVGLMPTYARVSNRGVIPMAWTLDHVGPICKAVEDAAILLGIIAGYDPADPTTLNVGVPDYQHAFKMQVSKLRVGLPRVPFFDGLDSEFARAIDGAIAVIKRLVASVADVELPPAVAAPTIWGPETYAWHAKWLAESPEKYQTATRTQMVNANNVRPDVYAEARHQVDVARREIAKVFAKVDVLVTPTLKVPPATIAASLNPPAPNPAGRGGVNTGGGNAGNPWAFDIYGIPAITLPCGFTSAGLPVGLQISAGSFAETNMLALAHAFEQATEWHKRRPNFEAIA